MVFQGSCNATIRMCEYTEMSTSCLLERMDPCKGTVLTIDNNMGSCDPSSGMCVVTSTPVQVIDCAATNQVCRGGACVDP